MWAFDEMFPNIKTCKIMKVLREAWIRHKDSWFSLTGGLGGSRGQAGSSWVHRSSKGLDHAPPSSIGLWELTQTKSGTEGQREYKEASWEIHMQVSWKLL